MLKKLVVIATVACLLVVVASAIQADVLYMEDWKIVKPHSGWGPIGPYMKADNSGNIFGVAENTGWDTGGPPAVEWSALQAQRTCATSDEWEDFVPLPGGDDFRINVGGGESSGLFMWADAATVAAADRVETQMSVWYSASPPASDNGFHFVAEVGGAYYVTDLLGLGITSPMATGGSRHYCRVNEWLQETVDLETADWFLWDDTPNGGDADPTNGYDNPRPDGGATPRTIPGIDTTPVPLPSGDIGLLGILLEKGLNEDVWAFDDLFVTNNPGMVWDGGEGLWADSNWNGGSAPAADLPMVINAETDDSVVTVAADFITGGTGPAASVFVGEEYAARLTVAGGVTLEVTGETTAGEFGKIAIENGATLQTDSAVIEIDGRLIAGVQGSAGDSGLVDSAGQLTIEDAEAIQVDWMPGSDAASMFGGTYTIAQYSGTALATTGTTANEDANIGAAYIKSIDYAADLGGGVLGVNVELHAQGLGDTDLDGDVDGDDLATFGLAWAPSGTDKTWFDGDFDFDGDIDGDDLAALGLAWAPSGIDFPAGDLQVTAVPEPGTIVMLLIGMAGLLIYRKRR